MGGRKAPVFKAMDYHFLCNDCQMVQIVTRPMEDAGEPAWCQICSEPMQRMFFPPKLTGRSKPGSFKWDKMRLNGWDDRIATLKQKESEGPASLREFKSNIGNTLFNATLKYKKEKYAS